MIAYEYFFKMTLVALYNFYLTEEVLNFLVLIVPWLALTLENFTAPFITYPVLLLVVLYVFDNMEQAYKLIRLTLSDDETLFISVREKTDLERVQFLLIDAIYKVGLYFLFGSVDPQNDIILQSSVTSK